MTVCRSSWLAGVCLALTAGAQAQDAPASPPAAATAAPQALPGKIDATTPAPPASGAAPASPPSDESPPPATETAPTEFKPGMLGQGTQTGRDDQRSWHRRWSTRGDTRTIPMAALDKACGRIRVADRNRGPVGKHSARQCRPVRAIARPARGSDDIRFASRAGQARACDDPNRKAAAGWNDPRKRAQSRLHSALKGDMDFARVQADALLYAGRDKDVCSDMTATRADVDRRVLATASPLVLRRIERLCIGGTDARRDRCPRRNRQGVGRSRWPMQPPGKRHRQAIRPSQPRCTSTFFARLVCRCRRQSPPSLERLRAAMAARDTRNSPADRLAAATRISQTGALSPAEIDGNSQRADDPRRSTRSRRRSRFEVAISSRAISSAARSNARTAG